MDRQGPKVVCPCDRACCCRDHSIGQVLMILMMDDFEVVSCLCVEGESPMLRGLKYGPYGSGNFGLELPLRAYWSDAVKSDA